MALVDGSQPGLLHGLLPAVEAEVGQALAGEGRSSPAAPVVTLGVPDGAKAATIAALRQRTAGPLLAIRPRPNDAQALLEELQAWLPAAAAGSLLLFPPRESLPYEQRPQSDEAAHARLTVLAALAAGDAPLIVTDGQALSQRTRPRGPALPRLRPGAQLAIEPFLATLGGAGYRAAAVADEAGTFARRGGIIDVFPPATERPVRIELLGDTIDSLRSYDPLTQRSVQPLAEAVLQPASEATVDKAAQAWAASLRKALRRGASVDSPAGQSWARDLEQIEGGALPGEAAFWTPFLAGGTLWDHLPPETLIIREEAEEIRHHLDELDELAERTRETLEGRGDIPAGLPHPHLRRAELSEALESRRPRIDLQRFGQEEPKQARRSLGFTPVAAYGGRLRMLIDDLRRVIDRGERVTLVSLQAPRLAELLQEHGLPVAAQAALVDPPPAGAVTLVRGSAPAGWGLPASDGGGQVLLTDREVFSFAKQRRPRPARPRKHTTFLDDLQPGHYVVHVEHGIGRFVGVTREQVGGREYEYLELEYAGSDRLLVPTDQLRRLQRYIGPSGSRPSLTRLGTQQWQRAKQRVRAAVRQLAEELLQLYATRQVVPGLALAADSPWQMELEAAFPYLETADQAEAVGAVKADQERSRPMDRIVVGDVGYGKTEVAVRAAFKAVMSGQQVAMLVPTTVLAQQHLGTFRERMAPFSVRIEMLSRFRSAAQQRTILADLAAGRVDIVIGTHRLLQKDVRLKTLGLLIIDEEQRFGVESKESLKRLRREVDVLTLSATPIPRTLYMALSGIRDMSTIETPPEERQPITTAVMETDDAVVREAVLRELERGGQVYFVHNRVQSIEMIARWLRELVPEARFLVAHGQMPEEGLEEAMLQFVAGEADVLVCTTIIESGLDIPNVNTIIVHQAQRLGLSQLYQLRGRVGRSAAQAYAYLLYDRHQALTEPAQKRLQAIFDATALGAGFQIALRDLEIRGAGNLLGAEQSGYIGAVGFELYTQLLTEAVERLRAQEAGRPPPPPRRGPQVAVDLPLVAHIPESYIEDINLRLSIYQRLAALEEPGEVEAMDADLRDRFGPPPPPVTTLLRLVRLRTLAAQLGAESLQREEDWIALRLPEGMQFHEAVRRASMPVAVQVGQRRLRFDLRHCKEPWLDVLERLLEQLVGLATVARPTASAAPAGRPGS